MTRKMLKFWLDDTKKDENRLLGQVDELKRDRLFSSTIRDGIRLMVSLRNGSLDVLFELFPFVKAEFLDYMKEVQTTPAHSDIKSDIERLERLIKSQGTQPSNSGIKPIGGLQPMIAGSIEDDDDIELNVTQSESSGIDATQNFLASIMSLQK